MTPPSETSTETAAFGRSVSISYLASSEKNTFPHPTAECPSCGKAILEGTACGRMIVKIHGGPCDNKEFYVWTCTACVNCREIDRTQHWGKVLQNIIDYTFRNMPSDPATRTNFQQALAGE